MFNNVNGYNLIHLKFQNLIILINGLISSTYFSELILKYHKILINKLELKYHDST